MNDYPWYEEVRAESPITQGDIIEDCPVLTFDQIPELPSPVSIEGVLTALESAYGVLPSRTVVMTQACDLAQGGAVHVALCPIYNLGDHKLDLEEVQKKTLSSKDWQSRVKQLRDGRILNYCLLNERNGSTPPDISIPHQVVNFQEIFSLPLNFLSQWVVAQNRNRLRLLPPYREHLSQAFARYFMRVALPKPFAPVV